VISVQKQLASDVVVGNHVASNRQTAVML